MNNTPDFLTPDFLTPDGIRIKQNNDGNRFTSDAIALANFVKCKPTDTVIDAGCGGGVISLIIADKYKCKVTAVDIDGGAAKLAQENVALNRNLNIRVFNDDIREFHKSFGANLADVIVCNPPYFQTGPQSPSTSRAAARHNTTLTLEDLCLAATRLLKYGGKLFLCYPIDQISKLCQVLENNDFRVKELKLLPHLVLVHAKKSRGHPSAKIIL